MFYFMYANRMRAAAVNLVTYAHRTFKASKGHLCDFCKCEEQQNKGSLTWNMNFYRSLANGQRVKPVANQACCVRLLHLSELDKNRTISGNVLPVCLTRTYGEWWIMYSANWQKYDLQFYFFMASGVLFGNTLCYDIYIFLPAAQLKIVQFLLQHIAIGH